MKVILNEFEGGALYALFFFLAYLLSFALLLWEGKRRKFPFTSWLLLTLSGIIAFIIGCKVGVFDQADWRYVWEHFALPNEPGKTILGGILLAVPAVIFVRKFLSIQHGGLDALAYVLPVCSILQRVGCLMAGCCFGKPTYVPWGVAYSRGAVAHVHHVHEGWVSADALSLAVHPVPLYNMFANLLIILMLFKFRDAFKRKGNILFFSVALFASFRFLIEFFRDAAAHVVGGEAWWGLNIIQWSLLVVISVVVFFIIKRERSKPALEVEEQHVQVHAPIWKHLSLFVLLSTVVFALKGWLIPIESITLFTILLIAYSILAYHIYQQLTLRLPKWLSVAFLAMPPVLMGQTQMPDAKEQQGNGFWTVYTGIATGSHELTIEDVATDCDGRVTGRNEATYDIDYRFGGGGLSRTIYRPYGMMTLGMNGLYGNQREVVTGDIRFEDELTLLNINPYFGYDWGKFAMTTGFHVGNITYLYHNLSENNDLPISQLRQFRFLPHFSLRYGKTQKVFVETGFMSNPFTSMGGSSYEIKFGTGLDMTNGTALKFGIATHGLLLEGQVPIRNRLMLDLHVSGIEGPVSRYRRPSNFRSSIGLKYFIGKNE